MQGFKINNDEYLTKQQYMEVVTKCFEIMPEREPHFVGARFNYVQIVGPIFSDLHGGSWAGVDICKCKPPLASRPTHKEDQKTQPLCWLQM